ncbi:MAG: alpha-L-fucosidase, partial [Pirellulales bacterium]
MCRSLRILAVLLFALAACPAAAEEAWYDSPSLSIMTGFIYEPLKPYTIHQWKETLGGEFDADRWAKDFKEAGAQHLVFYDKWIDGLVFHDTKTTDFKTDRDFVRELAAACQRRDLPLVFYFNAVSDGNPEFDDWALLDRGGNPIVFAPMWPTRYQTLHSPFRKKAVEQVRELLSDYGPIHGIWHDVFRERLNTSSAWVAQGYRKMYGEGFEQASPARLAEFNARTLAGYLDEVDAIRREQHQDNCIFTANGSGSAFLASNVWTREVGSRLHYLFNEGHGFTANDRLAQMAWVLPKPLEINLLLSSTWFTPMEDAPPPPAYTEKQVIAATAIAVCQGASIHFALTPGHSGLFGQDLQQAKAAGAWFRQVQPILKDAQPYADVAIVLGSPALDGPGQPAQAWAQAIALRDTLDRAGIFSRFLYDTRQGGSWPDSLAELPVVIIPELAVLDDAHVEQIRQYVEHGGRLIAFGHASMLDARGERKRDYALGDVLGVRYGGELALPAREEETQVKVDSEYSTEFAGKHLVDGQPTAWASGGTPMPHWVEITLPEPADVAVLELISRQGPYLVTGMDVEAKDQDGWKVVGSVRGATTRGLSVTFDPVQTKVLRVTILRELYQGQDRQYADVEAIRVLDKERRDCSTNRGIPIVATTEDLRQILEA